MDISSSNQYNGFSLLPEELVCTIIRFTTPEDLSAVADVCRLWRRLMHEYSITGKICTDIINCSRKKEFDLDSCQLDYLQTFQSYVHKLDLSTMSCDTIQFRLLDTISLLFDHLTELRMPSYSLDELNNIYTTVRRSVKRKQIQRLSKCRKLDTLVLDYCDLDEKVFDLIGKMPSLRNLSLYKAIINKQSFEDLAGSESLELIMLSHTSINMVEAKALSNIKNLKKLALYLCEVSPEANKILSKMTHLTHIIVNETALDIFKNKEVLRQFQDLKYFSLSTKIDFDQNVLDALLDMPNLQNMELLCPEESEQKWETLMEKYEAKYGREFIIHRSDEYE